MSHSTAIDLSTQVEQSEELLIHAAKTSPHAFDTLYRRYVERIYAYLYSFTYDAAETEDLTSQTFISAWKGLRHYKEQGTFTAWLFRIAQNKARDLHRRKRHQIPIDAAENLLVEWDPASKFEESETLQQVTRLIQRLAPEQIELLRLRFSAGLSYIEIGAILGHSTEATKMAFHRLYQKLRSEWKVYDE